MAVENRIEGLAALKQALRELSPKLRRRALRNALSAGARVFRDEAKRLAPVISAASYAVRKGYRKAGTLRNAIRVRTSKIARRAGDVGVFVNVKPAKGAERGGKSPNDPFYWRFVEFGTAKAGAKAFLRPAANSKQGDALNKIVAVLGPAIQKLNTPR